MHGHSPAKRSRRQIAPQNAPAVVNRCTCVGPPFVSKGVTARFRPPILFREPFTRQAG